MPVAAEGITPRPWEKVQANEMRALDPRGILFGGATRFDCPSIRRPLTSCDLCHNLIEASWKFLSEHYQSKHGLALSERIQMEAQ